METATAEMTETKTVATTIRVRGREFGLTSQPGEFGLPVYTLKGVRGAVYRTMRNTNHRHQMFVVGVTTFGIPAGFQGCWLTDVSGALEVLR